ncbi:MAG: hypothetical protein R2694_11400 [Ilumatobacteraceae bacterium]|nr:hypothetical protein [Ilumatobacter sp.]MCB0983045.1 hypothetical protein [Ilumatobacter sp.]
MRSHRAPLRHRPAATALTAILALAPVACSDEGAATPTTAGGEPSASTSTVPITDEISRGPLPASLTCDPFDERACLLPWPNDAFTDPDPTTPTGRRLHLRPDTSPRNADGTPIDTTDQNRADGFSPMSVVLAMVPGLDTTASGVAPSTDIGASLADDAPVVLLDTTAGERLAHWGELDAPAPGGDQLLMVHPAAALPEGHRIVVALRHLVDTTGAAIPATTAFEAALEDTPEPPERREDVAEILADLDAAGVSADGLYLAWDFTVASADSLAGRALAMRDQAYAALAGAAPAFTVATVADDGGVRRVDGTFAAPNFLTGDGAPGSTLLLGDDGLPTRNPDQPDYVADFHCVLPASPAAPVPAIVYGHGLMGNRMEVDALAFAASLGQAAACATDEIGMSSDDIGNLLGILADLSRFPEQADRMVQGLLNQQMLGLLLNAPGGFVADPAFQDAAGGPLVANGRTQFVGNSQGGILGGAASAISNEWERVVLGVPGIGYSLLLPRSSDWPQFATVFDEAYPDPVDRVLALQLIQLLWDRGENAGYAQHLTADPYTGTAAKRVLLVQAFGDHQVANVSTEILARTIGAGVDEPSLAPGRSADVDPQWGIPAADFSGEVQALLVVWDFGTPAPPTVNLPPNEPDYGQDPHGAGSQEPRVLLHALTFLITGALTDPCGDVACVSGVLSGAG